MQPHSDELDLRPPTTDFGSDGRASRSPNLLSSVRSEVEREARYTPVDTLEPAPARVEQDPAPELDMPGVGDELLSGAAMLLLITGGLFFVLYGAANAAGVLLAL